MKLNFEDAFAGDDFGDEWSHRAMINYLMENDDLEDLQLPKQKAQKATNRLIQKGQKGSRQNIQQIIQEQQYNFKQQLDIEGGKRYRNFKTYSPPKFKLLGYNQEGKPLFKFSDAFLTSDPRARAVVDKFFKQNVQSGPKNVTLQTGQLSKKYQKGYDFSKIVENWQKRQYQDFTNDKKNKMDEKQLEEIVVNRGDSKENYWVYKIGQKKKYDYQDIFEQKNIKNQNPEEKKQYYNHNLLNPRFVQNMHKAADRLRLQYAQIEQFESEQEEDQPLNGEKAENGIDQAVNNTQKVEDESAYNYWGDIKDKDCRNTNSKVEKPIKSVVVQQQIKQIVKTDPKKQGNKQSSTRDIENQNVTATFVEQIINQFSTINHQIVNNSYKGPETLNQYNRIQFHLENPNFFLTKLHYALQKKSQQFTNFAQGTNKTVADGGPNRNANPSIFDRSVISGSRTDKQQTIRASQMEGNDSQNEDDDHQTIQKKIINQMSLQSRKPINHSDIATKLNFIKFSNDLDHFKNFHRFEFKYDVFFSKKTKIKILRHLKPLKCKGTDFNINVEKKDSYIKFARPQSLSLASEDIKQFILIEYIEQNPLLMSDVGMCERMMLQVNNKEMLSKISKDLIQQIGIDQYEDIRDNPQNNRDTQNTSTEHKMQLWRKNIKNHFGENGKVYLWQPKRQSKLIGNPDGLGVALMQSNLSAMPIVKKNPIKRDFLLVRQKDKWVLRKIDSVYVSGQVEPKQVVFSPGDRPYQTFLQKYQVDYLTKVALSSSNYKITVDAVKNYFPNTPQTSAESRIRKILKQKMNAETKDNKTYQIKIGEDQQVKFKLQPEDFCLYERMQKSLCQLEDCGIQNMKNMEKMKSILRKYFRKSKTKDLDHFATARMIRDQLQLTSWYLTESFRKFIDKNARIEMVGHADPTNGHGGYSFIKKPQKQRTDKDQAQQKPDKNKLSGTEFDLRKLKAKQSVALLQQLGYDREALTNKKRWGLVSILKSQKDTEYSRKQRQSKQLKQQNERKQRSKALNLLLKYLRNEEQGLIEPYEYGYNPYLDLEYYRRRQKANWQIAKQKLQQNIRNNVDDDNDDDGDDED